MKCTRIIFFSCIAALIYPPHILGKKLTIQHNVSTASKPSVSSMQKQLVKNAKVNLKTFKANLKKSEKTFRKAKTEYNKAQKAHTAALNKKNHGKTQAERLEGRKAAAVTSTKLVAAQNAYFAADKQQRSLRNKNAEAKKNLRGIRKLGWQKFFARQQGRDVAAPSMVMPRIQRTQTGTVNSAKFKQELANVAHKNGYSGL